MAKSYAAMSDEELDAAAVAATEARAADEEKHKGVQLAIRQERDNRVARARAEELKAQLADLPEEIRMEVIGG